MQQLRHDNFSLKDGQKAESDSWILVLALFPPRCETSDKPFRLFAVPVSTPFKMDSTSATRQECALEMQNPRLHPGTTEPLPAFARDTEV